MESAREAERLLIKGDRKSTREQLILTGFDKLPSGAHIVDAGCGAGFVSDVMAELAEETRNPMRMTLADGSKQRLEVATSRLAKYTSLSIEPQECNLALIPLEDNCADYVFCRFVFEYLPNQEQVFNELLRITKPGGRLVIGDLDYNCLSHYPLDPDIEKNLKWTIDMLHSKNVFDPYAGRRLYSFFFNNKMRGVKPHVIPHHLFYGRLSDEDRFNWDAKLRQIEELNAKKVINVPFDLKDFRTRFMKFLESPGRFSYTPLILVEGVKPT